MQNELARHIDLESLKSQLKALDRCAPVDSGLAPIDAGLVAPLARQSLHDLYAPSVADAAAVNAFGLGLAAATCVGKPVVWAIHDMMGLEAGQPYAPGMVEMGLDPDRILLVRARDIKTVLSIGEEALRSPAIGAVLLSAWGESRSLTLTATKRLAMAAKIGGGTAFLARASAEIMSTAAESRWSISAAASRPMEGEAPGHPSFEVTLLRHRNGGSPQSLIMEWDRERRVFVEPTPLSGDLVSVASLRSQPQDNIIPLRRTG